MGGGARCPAPHARRGAGVGARSAAQRPPATPAAGRTGPVPAPVREMAAAISSRSAGGGSSGAAPLPPPPPAAARAPPGAPRPPPPAGGPAPPPPPAGGPRRPAPRHRLPRVLHGRPRLVGPMKLIKVDLFDAEPAKRRFALLPDGVGPEHAARFFHAVALVPYEATLGEHERPFAGREVSQQTTDHLF